MIIEFRELQNGIIEVYGHNDKPTPLIEIEKKGEIYKEDGAYTYRPSSESLYGCQLINIYKKLVELNQR